MSNEEKLDSTELSLEEAGILYRDSVRRCNALEQQKRDLEEKLRIVEDQLEDEGRYRSKANKAVMAATHRLPG